MADNIKYRFIQNVGDYFPSGYFSEDFIDKVQKASGVSSDEMNALCAPYVQLRREYEAYKNYIVNTNPRVKDAIKHTHDFNNRLLQILGYSTEETYHFYGVDEDAQSVVPVRQVLHRGNGVSMLVMEMQHLIQVGDKQPSGLFEQRYKGRRRKVYSSPTILCRAVERGFHSSTRYAYFPGRHQQGYRRHLPVTARTSSPFYLNDGWQHSFLAQF